MSVSLLTKAILPLRRAPSSVAAVSPAVVAEGVLLQATNAAVAKNNAIIGLSFIVE